MAAMAAEDVVLRLQRQGRADGRRLLPDREMRRALVGIGDALVGAGRLEARQHGLELAHDHHVAEDGLQRCRRRGRPARRRCRGDRRGRGISGKASRPGWRSCDGSTGMDLGMMRQSRAGCSTAGNCARQGRMSTTFVRDEGHKSCSRFDRRHPEPFQRHAFSPPGRRCPEGADEGVGFNIRDVEKVARGPLIRPSATFSPVGRRRDGLTSRVQSLPTTFPHRNGWPGAASWVA